MVQLIIFLIPSLICSVIVYACCVASGRISRLEEERRETNAKSD